AEDSSSVEVDRHPLGLPRLQLTTNNTLNYSTTGWTPIMENYHMQCVQKAQGYAWMHFQASSYWKKRYMWLTIPAALLSVLIGTAGLGSLSELANNPIWYLFLVMFCLN